MPTYAKIKTHLLAGSNTHDVIDLGRAVIKLKLTATVACWVRPVLYDGNTVAAASVSPVPNAGDESPEGYTLLAAGQQWECPVDPYGGGYRYVQTYETTASGYLVAEELS